MFFHAGKSGDLRGEHGAAAGFEERGDPGAAGAGQGRGQGRPGKAHLRQSAAGALGGAEVRRARREHGRFVPGRLHRPHQGHRRLRSEPERPVFHLRRSHDRRGAAALSAGSKFNIYLKQ